MPSLDEGNKIMPWLVYTRHNYFIISENKPERDPKASHADTGWVFTGPEMLLNKLSRLGASIQLPSTPSYKDEPMEVDITITPHSK